MFPIFKSSISRLIPNFIFFPFLFPLLDERDLNGRPLSSIPTHKMSDAPVASPKQMLPTISRERSSKALADDSKSYRFNQ